MEHQPRQLIKLTKNIVGTPWKAGSVLAVTLISEGSTPDCYCPEPGCHQIDSRILLNGVALCAAHDYITL